MLIALTGLPRAGKDSAAEYLIAAGFHRASFATALYNEIATAFGVTVEQLMSHEWKTMVQEELSIRNCRDINFIHRVVAEEVPRTVYNVSPLCQESTSCPRTSRFILQRWATEYRRNSDPLYWVNKLGEHLETLPKCAHIVVTDLREMHEYNYLGWFTNGLNPMKLGVLEITRPGAVSTGHSSDQGLPKECIDGTISNDGTIAELHHRVFNFMRDLKWKSQKTA